MGVPFARADYPIMLQHYAADPTVIEWNERLYVYCSGYEEHNDTEYLMGSIVCFSTGNLKYWTLASAGVTVQSRTNIVWGNWVNVTSPAPQIVQGQWQVTLPVSVSTPAAFYRLVK